MPAKTPFTQPTIGDRERDYVLEALESRELAGNGRFTKACQSLLEQKTGAAKVILTHSATGALDMMPLVLDMEPGDEVIVPSFTFVSTANAFALRGVVPVFVDVRADTLNLDETLIEGALTGRTRAVVPVHYAGVACEMDTIMEIARRHGLAVLEDAAQGIGSTYKGKPLGSFGELSALSFHATKNITAGEGGALLINEPALIERAEIAAEKGTNRSLFVRGEVDKYTWVDLGSSFMPGEMSAALLLAQLEQENEINDRRRMLWERYHHALMPLEQRGLVHRPTVPAGCVHNGHIYYLMFTDGEAQQRARNALVAAGFNASSHYGALHNSPAARRFGRAEGRFAVTEHIATSLLRLPLFAHMETGVVDRVSEILLQL
ncbi:MAG: dTDP-4-amino-4,6-dideoxygalactose transaminase [Parvibaculaceae bacterium]|nr:dTDP-4-amino-4,6-dideoxygalactose transaminase [Parvibaculaceae bacterium]